MLKTHILTLGDYQTNCYIIHDSESTRCCVIDPGYEPNVILRYLNDLKLELDTILLTHGHFDHVGGVKIMAAETDCEVYLHANDLALPPVITNGKLYYTKTYPADGTITPAGLTIRVIHTPGHTPGSVCLLCEDAMFSGDTLFHGSCGRTDLPGGNLRDMNASLQKLAQLTVDYQVFPGHGDATTLEQEKKYNPYM